MTRREELEKVFEGIEGVSNIVKPLIDDVVFLEGQLTYLKTLPFIMVSKKNLAVHKPTPAAKQYKEFLQQYNNCIKILCSVYNRNSPEEESPLRSFLKLRMVED